MPVNGTYSHPAPGLSCQVVAVCILVDAAMTKVSKQFGPKKSPIRQKANRAATKSTITVEDQDSKGEGSGYSSSMISLIGPFRATSLWFK